MLWAAWCLYLADFLCVQTLREASAPKAPVWSPWTNNDCTASLLSSTQALHTVVSGFLKQSSHNRSGMPVFNGPAVSLPAPNCRETDPTHDWLRNSITGRVPWSKLSQFRDAHICSGNESPRFAGEPGPYEIYLEFRCGWLHRETHDKRGWLRLTSAMCHTADNAVSLTQPSFMP